MTTVVSNPTGDSEEKIHHAAKLLRPSRQRREVFEIIYSGQKQYQSIEEIGAKVSKFNAKTYVAASKLAHEGVILYKKVGTKLYYGKDGFYMHNKKKILDTASSAKKLNSFTTKRNPKVKVSVSVKPIKLLTKPKEAQVYVDEIDSFKNVKAIKKGVVKDIHSLAERTVNKGICNILGQADKNDWGGEENDIFGSIILGGKRVATAFALKGKATSGILTPKKMGKNGDQIQRLFKSAASVHVVVYHDRVAESVYDLMKIQATYKSVANGNKKIVWCVVDGDDLNRLITAYPKEFGIKSK